MSRSKGTGSSKGRLGRLLGLFFIALALPSAVLTWQAYSRLQWESFHQYQRLAEELLGHIDRRLREMVAREEARSFADYRFLVIEGAPEANFVQRSPLSGFPVDSEIPGMLGYFQVDAQGRFTTPLLPTEPNVSALAYGVSAAELSQRQALREQLLHILSQDGPLSADRPAEQLKREKAGSQVEEEAVAARQDGATLNDVLAPSAASAPPIPSRTAKLVGRKDAESDEQKLAQTAFERLSDDASTLRKAKKQRQQAGQIGRVGELKLDRVFDAEQSMMQSRRPLPGFKERVEYAAAPGIAAESVAPGGGRRDADPADATALVHMFESEVDPFEFGLVGREHFVMYRKVWREGQRHIQGAVIEKSALLKGLIETPFRDTALAAMSRLGIAFEDEILSALGGQQGRSYLSSTEELSGTLLFRGRLSSPLDRLELIFSITRLPSGPAGGLVIWVALILGLVLVGGLILLYRLGVKQIELNHQQRDFVSAVSHELKTPLTSIRMYSEMLREGWPDEARRRSYYEFIHDESERLSRLITNVLQLARMSRDELRVEPGPITVAQLKDVLRSKITTQVEHAGFVLQLSCSEAAAARTLTVDDDAFFQIMINLVDNAIKFSARAEQRLIVIDIDLAGDGRVEIAVRDHGPGIPRDQLKKIFRLFYRSENELTRETVGTGIGLALVHRLTTAMGGEVDVINRDPGAEFRLRFPSA